MKKNCQICGAEFVAHGKRIETGKYCSKKCRGISLSALPNTVCSGCGREFHMKQSQKDRYPRSLGYFCSYKCMAVVKSREQRGDKNPNYKGKNTDSDGYRIYVPQGLNSLGLRSMKLHQAVCCEALGIQKVPKGFHVHHRDCDVENNDPSNLAVLTVSDHKWLHKQYGVATLWAFMRGMVSLTDLVSWSDDKERAARLLPLDVTMQSFSNDNFSEGDINECADQAA